MKRILTFVFISLLACGMVMAQKESRNQKSRAEMAKEIQEFKLKFLAQEMELKEDQQKKFFETYNEMTEERQKVYQSARELKRKVKHDANATEEDYRRAGEALDDARDKDIAIEKKYDKKFSTFLTSKQLYKMKNAEEKFRKRMQEMKKEHKHKGNKKTEK